MIRNILLTLIVAINLYFIIYFLRDLFKTNKISKKNQGICVCCPSRHLSSSFFQHWRFRLCYRNRPLSKVEMGQHEKLPGTLNTQCVVPVAVMALSYITAINVGIKTLAVCIICQIIGAYLGPRFVVKLPEKTIKLFVGIGLVIAALLILQDK